MNRLQAVFLIVLTATLGACTTVAPEERSTLTGRQVEAIRAALPSHATATPKRPRKLLIFTDPKGSGHPSMPWATKALELMGRTTGAYEPTVSNDLALMEPEALAQFDAIFMVHTHREWFLPLPDRFKTLSPKEQQAALTRDKRLKQSLVDFVSNGGGMAGLHAAADAFYEWPKFREMLGAFYDGHPWNDPNEISTLRVEEPDHPLCGAFGGKTALKIGDELYQFKEPYSRDHMRVLLSIDLTGTQTDREYTRKNIRRTDGDFAVAWIRPYKKGRVYYCSLGHSEKIYTNPTILKFYLDGIQYVLRDLDADDTPRQTQGESAR